MQIAKERGKQSKNKVILNCRECKWWLESISICPWTHLPTRRVCYKAFRK